ncbi:uncharacterized protein LOC113292696 isoform X1 [Papaver somniferum]|uniref:uncharacterized protein LOC113292696 isoform X1 n=2 Tax=Papaver somniferum TaxID=3469 RepID=UPI000E705599|nr:uncharacterized protein LOC113292696 isoform X1 [Papaver somniferum]XP_026397355.1 uncharacterized protein LOC113292696 isoform X1 [Papaver somniferum]
MEPSSSNCISVDEQSGFLQKESSPPSQQKVDESMDKPQVNVAGPIQLDTQMELEHSGSSQILLGLPSPHKIGETIQISHINDSEAQLNPIQREAENGMDATEEEQYKMKLDDTTTDEQDEPYFLTDKPYFHCILAKTQLYNMGIPKSVSQLLPEEEVPVILSYQNKTWRMKYCGNRSVKRFDPSWKYFVQDNNLKVGDGCVFELTAHGNECIKFRVQILDGDIPCEFLDRVEGETINHPIVIGLE